jgi:hypothetical protein
MSKINSCPRCNSYLYVVLLEVSDGVKHYDYCNCGLKWREKDE